MKTLFIVTLFCYSILLIAAINAPNGNAKTDKIQGLDVYVFSTPLQDYKVIESGKVLATLTGSCGETVNQSVKKAAKAGADAVIVDLSSSKWEAIKYE